MVQRGVHVKFLLTILRTEYVYTNEGDALISDTMLLLIYLSFQVYIRIEISYDFQSKYIEIYIGIMTNKIFKHIVISFDR